MMQRLCGNTCGPYWQPGLRILGYWNVLVTNSFEMEFVLNWEIISVKTSYWGEIYVTKIYISWLTKKYGKDKLGFCEDKMLLHIEYQSAHPGLPHTSVASHLWVSLLCPHPHHADTLNSLWINKMFSDDFADTKINSQCRWNYGTRDGLLTFSHLICRFFDCSALTPHDLGGWPEPGRLRFKFHSCQKILCLDKECYGFQFSMGWGLSSPSSTHTLVKWPPEYSLGGY